MLFIRNPCLGMWIILGCECMTSSAWPPPYKFWPSSLVSSKVACVRMLLPPPSSDKPLVGADEEAFHPPPPMSPSYHSKSTLHVDSIYNIVAPSAPRSCRLPRAPPLGSSMYKSSRRLLALSAVSAHTYTRHCSLLKIHDKHTMTLGMCSPAWD